LNEIIKYSRSMKFKIKVKVYGSSAHYWPE
jgi:hypothetical protein